MKKYIPYIVIISALTVLAFAIRYFTKNDAPRTPSISAGDTTTWELDSEGNIIES